MSKLIILFEKSNTLIGRIGRVIDPYPYTHVSISFDGENYYSFSRRKHHNPFDSGFTNEKLNYYAYKDGESVEIKLYEIEISDKQKEKIIIFMDDIKDYPFDIYGMIKTSINMPREKHNAYNCMTFVSTVLKILDIPLKKNPIYRNDIKDIEDSLLLNNYHGQVKVIKKEGDNSFYMEKVKLKDIFKSFININKKLRNK